jgi:ankyrin repeat protein
MSDKTGYFDKPYRPTIKMDGKQIIDLFNIVSNMNINDVKQFVLVEQIPLNITDNNGNTLIHYTISNSDILKTEDQRLHMIKYLYNENVNPDSPNNMNLTPLHLACIKQYYNIIKYLIDIGVDVNYQDNFGNTPLHRLFSGNIKPEEKTTIGQLVPIPKKQDLFNMEKWKDERIKIWDDIKDSPFIQSITSTLKASIGSENDEINVVKEFQEQLLQLKLDFSKQDDIKKLKDLQAASIHKFKSIIEQRWEKFANIGDIIIHPTEQDSFPNNDPSKLSIIKNSNKNKHIYNNLTQNFNKIKTLLKIEYPDIIFSITDIYDRLLETFLRQIRSPLNQDTFIDNTDDYNEFNNLFKHELAEDFADNIMDVNKKTMIGGSRMASITDVLLFDDYSQLFTNVINPDFIIPTLVYTLVCDFSTAITFNGDYNIMETRAVNVVIPIFYDLTVDFIVKFINDNITNEQTRLISYLNNNINFAVGATRNQLNYQSSLLKFFERPVTNKINWLYCFINNFLCNENNTTNLGDPNLIFNIRMGLILLMGGLINNQSNLTLSISQSMRVLFYDFCFNPNKFGFSDDMAPNDIRLGSVLSAWLYVLLTTNSNEIFDNVDVVLNDEPSIFNHIDTISDNDELKTILKLAFRIFNNDQISDLNINIDSVSSGTEKLCVLISNYYNNMDQPPQSQHIADIISIIRKHNKKTVTFERLKNLIIGVTTMVNIPNNNVCSVIDININEMRAFDNNSKFFTIFGNDADAFWMISENALPSRFNYYLYTPYNVLRGNNNSTEIHTTLKLIESYYLGLNFMGMLEESEPLDKLVAGINSPINLFNFQPDPLNPINGMFNLMYDPGAPNFVNNITFHRPATIMSVGRTIARLETTVNSFITFINSKLLFMFNNLTQTNMSSTYATVISYTYPILLNLSKYSNLLVKMSQDVYSYNDALKYLIDNYRMNLKEILDRFKPFNISNFENIINAINGYMYILYYINADNFVKIPKFIYHSLGNKPLIVFDKINESINILNPQVSNNVLIETDTNRLDKNKGKVDVDYSLYNDIINNIGYINKLILDEYYIASKNKKLPPSLKNLLFEFYRYNVIDTIINNNTIIDDNVITEELNNNTKNIQKQYIKAKIIEELIQLYLKNKINEYGRDIYNSLIRNRLPQNIDISKLFEKYDFRLQLDKMPSESFTSEINISTQQSLKFFYSFVEPKKINKQFFIYPDNYFGTNLLKNKYIVDINHKIIELLLSNNANILIHNNEKISPLTMLIKNNYYEAFQIIKDNFDINMYDSNNVYSPLNYVNTIYKQHLSMYNNKFTDSQYKELETIIQSNDDTYNNIMKYMDVSFKVVKYIVEEYITENILKINDDFTSINMLQLVALCGFNRNDIINMRNREELIRNGG